VAEMISSLFLNFPLIVALVTVVLTQVIKIFYYWLFRDHKFDLVRLFEAGGMPSSHAAVVAALSTAVGIQDGWGATTFAMAVVFSAIVMYDAAGVRHEVGIHAEVINQMIEESSKGKKSKWDKLKEVVGHDPMEVFVGAILGIILTLVIKRVFYF
jgi:uncharacterized protein